MPTGTLGRTSLLPAATTTHTVTTNTGPAARVATSPASTPQLSSAHQTSATLGTIIAMAITSSQQSPTKAAMIWTTDQRRTGSSADIIVSTEGVSASSGRGGEPAHRAPAGTA